MSGMGTSETKPFSDMRGTIAGTQKSVDNSLYGTATGKPLLNLDLGSFLLNHPDSILWIHPRLTFSLLYLACLV
jgi:hypothetical protein